MSLTNSVRWRVFTRDGFRCIYCGATKDDGRLEVDHKIPRSAGGTDDPDNLVTSCRPCNAGKSDRLEHGRFARQRLGRPRTRHPQTVNFSVTRMLLAVVANRMGASYDVAWRQYRRSGIGVPPRSPSDESIIPTREADRTFAELLGAILNGQSPLVTKSRDG